MKKVFCRNLWKCIVISKFVKNHKQTISTTLVTPLSVCERYRVYVIHRLVPVNDHSFSAIDIESSIFVVDDQRTRVGDTFILPGNTYGMAYVSWPIFSHNRLCRSWLPRTMTKEGSRAMRYQLQLGRDVRPMIFYGTGSARGRLEIEPIYQTAREHTASLFDSVFTLPRVAFESLEL